MRAWIFLLSLALPAWFLSARGPALLAEVSAGQVRADRSTESHPIHRSRSDGAARHPDETDESGATPYSDPLEPLFAAADASGAGLAPLILAASLSLADRNGDQGQALAERLEPYCQRAFFSPERDPSMQALGVRIHGVKQGEIPSRIVRAYGVSDGLLARLNEGYSPTRLQVGQELKLLDMSQGVLQLIVDRERHRLGAWRRTPEGGWLLVTYLPVGLGAPETPTPAGRTRVVERALDPEWRDPASGVVYPPGDPGNYLGGYWMRLDPEGIGKQGIGLHGFTRDEPALWLGRDASNGCVRLLQDDMDRVFHLALEGTPVQFVP